MVEALEQLLDSLLFEGYALYPYTRGATKNATPTPFGIVYPPAFAFGGESTFDHLRLCGALRGGPDSMLAAQVRFLASSGEGHEAEQRRLTLPAHTLGELAREPLRRRLPARSAAGDELIVGIDLGVTALGDGVYEASLRVANETPCPQGLDRPGALRRSLLSTHPLLTLEDARFISPLEHRCASVNTFPILAGDADDALLGATIALPDHPQIAPESLGGMFDSTEIEEALLLHVHALSDAEREELEDQDPVVREMLERSRAATAEQMLSLHGRVSLRDPPAGERERDPLTTAPPQVPAGLADPSAGEAQAVVGGVTFRRGGRVRIRPAPDADLHARMLAGRTARLERIFIDYDGRTHLGVTIDGDPGQDLMRETGRYLFFFADEVEVVAS